MYHGQLDWAKRIQPLKWNKEIQGLERQAHILFGTRLFGILLEATVLARVAMDKHIQQTLGFTLPPLDLELFPPSNFLHSASSDQPERRGTSRETNFMAIPLHSLHVAPVWCH